MNRTLRIALNTSPRQHQQLRQLQQAFAAVCNALAPLVRETRCWNRVALHHMAYKQLRERFPELGSQMVCNAIYSSAGHRAMSTSTPTACSTGRGWATGRYRAVQSRSCRCTSTATR
jgi:hypothetical protein